MIGSAHSLRTPDPARRRGTCQDSASPQIRHRSAPPPNRTLELDSRARPRRICRLGAIVRQSERCLSGGSRRSRRPATRVRAGRRRRRRCASAQARPCIRAMARSRVDGPLEVRCSRHIAAVMDGVVHDTHDPSRGGTRTVYGYRSLDRLHHTFTAVRTGPQGPHQPASLRHVQGVQDARRSTASSWTPPEREAGQQARAPSLPNRSTTRTLKAATARFSAATVTVQTVRPHR